MNKATQDYLKATITRLGRVERVFFENFVLPVGTPAPVRRAASTIVSDVVAFADGLRDAVETDNGAKAHDLIIDWQRHMPDVFAAVAKAIGDDLMSLPQREVSR